MAKSKKKKEVKEIVVSETTSSEGTKKRSWTEEIEVTGEQLLKQVKKLAEEGRVKRIRVREPDGDLALDIPLTFGAIAGGAVVIAAPVLAVIGALAAFFSKVTIEIVREEEEDADKAA